MAATNYTPIQLYYSTTASTAPVAGNLTSGELAINITDGKLYYKDNGGVVQVMATKGTGSIGGATTQIQYNNAGALAGNAAMTFNSGTSTTTLTTLNLTNALGATYGGTAQSAYTQGDILYSSATNTLAKLGIGTTNYILTSTGTVPQWTAPGSIIVQTATNLAGGLAGSVPYQSAVDTTTFLAIGAANRIMSSSGTAPQWVTALTGLTGVSSSSITNTSLTSGRVVISSTAGLEADSANLTFNGTTLSTTGLSNTGFSTLVKTLALGDSNFNGTAVFAPATPAKLYLGTGTVTDVTSAASATNTTGAIASLAITPIAATNASVTYTNASTLYIAGAPSAGANVTITNPYSLYVAAGNAYFGGGLTFAGALSITDTTDATSTTTGSIKTAGGVGIAKSLWVGLDANIYGITVGRGAGAVATNTAVGASALAAITTGNFSSAFGADALKVATTAPANDAFGYSALKATTTGERNAAFGAGSLLANTTGSSNISVGNDTMTSNTTGSFNTALGRNALYSNTTASNNTAVGYQAGFSNTTGSINTFVGYKAGYTNTTGGGITAIGDRALTSNTTGTLNVALGNVALAANTTGGSNVALGYQALTANTTASNNTAVGYQAGYTNSTGTNGTYLGYQAGYTTTGSGFVGIGFKAGFVKSGADNFASVMVGNEAGVATTSGLDNTFVGGFVARANTTGSSNTALGTAALYSNTTASNNTAVGYQAGYLGTGANNTYLGYASGPGVAASSGANNTGIGYAALINLTTGATNTTLGYQAGFNITTGSNNVIIGGYTGSAAPISATGSNYIVLSDGAGNVRGTFNGSGNFGVGTTSPNTTLEVNKAITFGTVDTFGQFVVKAAAGATGHLLNFGVDSAANLSFIQAVNRGSNANTLVLQRYGATVLIGTTTLAATGGVLQLSAGITFPATQVAAADANTLDDYEEGAWTPTVSGVTLAASSGTYTKVGRQVFVAWDITWPTNTNTTGVTIASLPFTPATNSGTMSTGYTTYTSALVGVAGSLGIILYGLSGNPSSNPQNINLSGVRLIASVTYTV